MKRKRHLQYPELEKLQENRPLFFEIFGLFLFMVLLVIVFLMIILALMTFKLREMFCFIGLGCAGFYLIFIPIYREYSYRIRIIDIFEKVLITSGKSLSIMDYRWEPSKRILEIESSSIIYPNHFTITYQIGCYGWLIPPTLIIETRFSHPFDIYLLKGPSKNYYNFENDRIKKLTQDFNFVLNVRDYIINNTRENKLVARIIAYPILRAPHRGAIHVLNMLKLMQIIILSSTKESPVPQDMGKKGAFNPYAGCNYLATVCFKCEKAIKFWKKRERDTIPKCPHCGFPTKTIIAPYREDSTPHKIRLMKKVMESFDKKVN